jgi:hypothetical protein
MMFLQDSFFNHNCQRRAEIPAMCSSAHPPPPPDPMVMVNNKDGPAKARSNKYTRLVAEVQALHRSGD